jgi:hypothetical protein
VTEFGVLDVRTGNHVVRNATADRGGGIYNLGYVYLRESSVIDDNLANDGAEARLAAAHAHRHASRVGSRTGVRDAVRLLRDLDRFKSG